MVGNVKSLVDRLSKDFSAAKPPLAIHEPRKTVMPKSTPVQHVITTFAYTAAQDDELSLELGDIIEVLEEVEDGWSRGRQLRTGIVGMFPTNFVKPDVTPAAASHREEEKVVIRHTGEVDLPEANRRTPSVVGGVNVLAGKTTHSDVRDEPKTKGGLKMSLSFAVQERIRLKCEDDSICVVVYQ
ncbi:SH3 domain protein [Oesophagostomum dentatum]|uniref:SH3 domain protein n=1 Tax=Oesophagostomum dentatum TaxID=61180 RepID=A0A0B1TKS2_OESDE|nr:SH3 domain protein [Oesophagostomum dentatum]